MPLVADISYTEKKMAFGKHYSQDTLYQDVEMDLLLEFNYTGGQTYSMETVLKLEEETTCINYLKGLPLFSPEGKPSASLQQIIYRHYQVDK